MISQREDVAISPDRHEAAVKDSHGLGE
jgi:hypothetical protein